MKVRITSTQEFSLAGLSSRSSVSTNKTQKLWSSFMPRLGEVVDRLGNEFYSVEVYDNLGYFKAFDPTKYFEKWAMVKVRSIDNLPKNMKSLTIPSGDYAVFEYKGKPSEAFQAYQYIFGEWMAKSEYSLDLRPHFSLMGEKYLGENKNSEEEIWIPIRKL